MLRPEWDIGGTAPSPYRLEPDGSGVGDPFSYGVMETRSGGSLFFQQAARSALEICAPQRAGARSTTSNRCFVKV